MACHWYAVDAYQRLRDEPQEMVKRVAHAASQLSNREALQHVHKGKYSLPLAGNNLTGLQVIAWLAVSTDILSGYQLTDRGISFDWLKPARQLAKMPRQRDGGADAPTDTRIL